MKNKLSILILVLSLTFSIARSQSTKEIAEGLNSDNLLMPELTDFAKNNFTDKLEIAQFFFYWISANIEYDYEVKDRHAAGLYTEEDNNNNYSPFKVFERRKAVCEGYSQLYKWLMLELEIETLVIGGHVRHFTNPIVEPELDQKFSHAWNVSKIDGEWKIIDTTWSQQFETYVPDFYFDVSPENAIITHFPSEEKWQLLEKPLSLDEFNSSQYIDPLYFLTGFTEKPSLKQDENFYYFVYKNNPNRNWLVRLGYGTDSINYEPVPSIQVINQDGYTYYKFDKKHIPQKAAFKVDLNDFNEEKQTIALYENIILFRI
ncbi:Transglutaminase-like domain-containing protein [Maribacter orientalis]|uniref:Transglutaminase-like domain-containing protein n=1 Tax=Maribacter orientalis TaxID=228957 RepID=A0A1H7XEF1_9FLAO|nr:transglutaminase domain-containing protein [Maribacter orientalis]SEM31578.1 Transglutaminase-like domain-containing protein [Maribacter orientalis]